MVGKPGKSPLTAWHDSAQQPINQLWDEIEALRDSEARFRAIFENAAVGIARVAPDGHWLEVNQRFCDFVGYTREELMTKTFSDITHPDDLDADWNHARRLLAGEIENYSMEKRYYRKDGPVVWGNLTVSLVRKADGSPDYFVSVIEDISARKRAEEKLREREERLRLASRAAGLGVFEWDVPADRAVWENERMYEIFGHTRADGTLSRTQLVEKYIHPDDVATFAQALTGGMKSGRPFHTVYRIHRKDGALRWIELAGHFELARDGAPIRMIGVLADITERKRAEEANLKKVALVEDVSAALAEHGRPLQSMLQKSAEALVRHLDAAFALIWTLNPKESLLELQASAGLYTHLNGSHSRVAVGELKIGLIAKERRPHLTNDVANDPRISDPEWAREKGMVAFAGYPLLVEDRIVGVMAMFARHPLTEDTVEAIATIAAPVAQGIERKRAEEALRESELRFRTMISAIPDLSYETDADGANIFTSDQWRAYTGITAEESAGTGFIRAYHPDEAEDVLAQWSAAVRSGMSFERKCRIRAADGSYRWFLNRAHPGRDAEGRIIRWAGSLTDIDDLIRAEERVRESEQRFARFMRHLPGLAWIKDLQGRYVYANAAAVKAFRKSPEELYGRTDDEIFPPEVAAQFKENDQRALTNEEGIFVVETLEHEDGVLHYSAVRKFPIPGQDGREANIGGIAIDITESKRADEALRESEERLAGIVSSAMDAIITVDEDHRIVLFNEAAERMFGCPAAEALGQPFNRFIPERFRDAHTKLVRRFGETGGASRAMRSLTALRADGAEFPIEAAISKVEVGGRKLYTLIHRDITERKQAEAEREQLAQEQVARAAAEAANRSKDEFLAMVSHELRSPLNAILGYARMLRSGSADSEKIARAIGVIERSAKAQIQIIEDLLDSARIITGKLRIEPALIDLVPALEAALDTVRSAAEAKGVTLVANFGPKPEQALGDSTRLQQIVWNLLTNAVKFTPEGGRVELRIESDADNLRITVSDTGKGIEPGFLPFVFDSFRQADPSSARRYGGLGLGLSLVKHLVELHGGTITAASDGAERGATFTVTLPRRLHEFIAPPTHAVAHGEVRMEGAITLDQDLSLEGVSVLVVDDLEDARELLVQALSEYGAQVTAVSSGAEALAFLSDPPAGKRPDALILDIAMPDEDGYTALKKVRAMEAAQGASADQIPAIALTAYGRSEDRLRALRAGFNMHVAKPVEPAELAVVIASMTTRRVWEREKKD